MHLVRRAILAAMLLLPAINVAPAHADADADKRAAVVELLKATEALDMTSKIIDIAVRKAKEHYLKTNRKSSKKLAEIVTQEVKQAMEEDRGWYLLEVARIWERNFSTEELRALATFYRKPVGQKILKLLPEIFSQELDLGAAWSERLMPRIQDGIKSRIEGKKQTL